MSVKLTVEDVARVADLARLELSESEKKSLAVHLSDILVQFGRLQDLNTEGVAPTAHSIPMSNVLRSDVVIESLPRDQAVLNAPEKRDGNFIVPQIVEQ
jgi:aspartyl-tRNA(Asn)/glutamyl-tRNA(Gln) amidotransferase subunit C